MKRRQDKKMKPTKEIPFNRIELVKSSILKQYNLPKIGFIAIDGELLSFFELKNNKN